MSTLSFLLASFYREPDSDGHSRLPRRPRRGARRDFRGPLAGSDRRAGHHHRRCSTASSRTAGRLYGQPHLHLHRRGGLLHHPRPPRAHPTGGHHRHLLRGGVGGRDPGDEQVGRADRAPQGNAGGQHPDRLVAGGGKDRHPLRRHRPVPLHLPPQVPADLDGPRGGRGAGHLDALLGFPVLRLVRLRGDLVGGDRRRAAGVLLPDRAVGGGHALRREHRHRGWRSAGPWARSSPRWASTCRCRSTCRPAPPSSARSRSS